MSTKDSLYMQDKKQSLCPMCKYSAYNVLNDDGGWNCNKRESGHYTKDWDLPVESITCCDFFLFAIPIMKKIVENEKAEREAKMQTTLECF